MAASPPAATPDRHPGWPAVLGPVPSRAGQVRLRPLRRSDGPEWRRTRIQDERLLAPWDATSALAWSDRHSAGSWRGQRMSLQVAARHGEMMPFAVEVDGRFSGQMTIGTIQRGVLQSAWLGYWIESALHHRGVGTVAAALAVGHAFGPGGLHRLEATIAPENAASRALVGRLGFREEGVLRRYLHVGGGWRDHLLFALTSDEVPGGTEQLLARSRAPTRPGGDPA